MVTFYSGLVLYALFTSAVVLSLAGSFLLKGELGNSQQVWHEKLGFTMSRLAILFMMVGLLIFFWKNPTQESLPYILIQAAIVLATLCGFYILYLTFMLQREQKDNQHIMDYVVNRINYHLRIAYSFTFRFGGGQGPGIDPPGDPLGGPPEGPPNHPFGGMGASAFQRVIQVFSDNYDSLETEWLWIILQSIKEERTRNNLSTDDLDLRFDKWDKQDVTELWLICENEYDAFRNHLIKSKYLKERSCKQVFLIFLYMMLFFSLTSFLNWAGKAFDYGRMKEFYDRASWRDLRSDDLWDAIVTYEDAGEPSKFHVYGAGEVFVTQKHGIRCLDLQAHLGHYFRNLYGIFIYISGIEDEKIREECRKLAKSQLSTYEQALIFLNSLTPVGKVWELEGDNKFFSHFKVIENIPEGLFKEIDPKKDVYPHLRFEYEDYVD